VHERARTRSMCAPESPYRLFLSLSLSLHIGRPRALATGADSIVYKVDDAILHRRVALKTIKQPAGDLDLRTITRLRDEVRVLCHLREVPGVVRCLGAFAGDGGDVHDVGLVFSLHDTDLAQHLLHEAPRRDCIQRLVTQLVDAIAWMHARRVLHRDLKPANLLIDTETQRLLVCDFGLARAFTEEEWTSIELGLRNERSLTVGLCTYDYRAPEMCMGASYASPIDVWAAGCIVVEMMWWGADRPRARLYDWSADVPGDQADDVPSHGPLRALLRALRPTRAAVAHLPAHWCSWCVDFVGTLPASTSPWYEALRGQWEDEAIRTVEAMLAIDPARRPTAWQLSTRLHMPVCAVDASPSPNEGVERACSRLRDEIAELATLHTT
jgi:serine/threonine protein kinase